MRRRLVAAAAALAMTVAAHAGNLGNLGNPFVCKPREGQSTCMQGVLVLDDITLSVLAGASDEAVEDTVLWVRSLRTTDERGWNQLTPRMAVLAMRGALEVDPRKIAVLRRAEVRQASTYLLPIARIETTPSGGKPPLIPHTALTMRAIESNSRVVYGERHADVCSTTARHRYCVRIDGLSTTRRASTLWRPYEHALLQDYRSATPEPLSNDWMRYTTLGIEVRVDDKSAKAIDGARVVRATAQRLVLFNDSYIAGAPIAAGQQGQ